MKRKVTPKRIAGAAVWMIVLPAVIIAQLVRGEKMPKIKKQ